LTSSTGGALSETRMVSPMPSDSSAPKATADLMVPWKAGPGLGDAQVQRVVALLAQQPVGLHHDHRVVVLDRDLDVPEVVLLEQRALPQRRLDQRLGRGLAVLGHDALVQAAGVDADPDRRAAGLGRAGDLADLAVELADVARVDATAAQPASIAAKMYLLWKWMSAITGSCDFVTMTGSASASTGSGRPPGRSGSRSRSARRSAAACR
jgi:hypothetical protein